MFLRYIYVQGILISILIFYWTLTMCIVLTRSAPYNPSKPFPFLCLPVFIFNLNKVRCHGYARSGVHGSSEQRVRGWSETPSDALARSCL